MTGGENMKRALGIIFIILLTLAGGGVWQLNRDSYYNQFLRLHIIANSDDPADQALKLQVRDAVVAFMRVEFQGLHNVQEARSLAVRDIPRLEGIAAQVVAEHGYKYPVSVVVGDCLFPTRSYGDLVLPQGQYQAVRIILGEGKGKNWWCVLFPPLCLVSSSDQGLSLSHPEQPQVKFKCLELLSH